MEQVKSTETNSNNNERLAVVENKTDTNTNRIERIENKIDKLIDMLYETNVDLAALKSKEENKFFSFVGKYPKSFFFLSVVAFVLISGGGVEGVVSLLF